MTRRQIPLQGSSQVQTQQGPSFHHHHGSCSSALPPPSTTSTPKGPAPCPTSCSLGKPAGLRRMRRMHAGREGGSGPALWALTICTGHIGSVQPRQPTVQTVGSFGLSPSSGTTCSLTLNEAIVPPRTNVREKVG